MREEKLDDFAILILSCDKYADLWPITMMQFKQHFPHCPYKIYFGSNNIRAQDSDVISLLSGEDNDWSSSYLSILKQIPEKKLFILLEDLIVVSRIDREQFAACVEFLNEPDVKHIKYWPYPKPDRAANKLGFSIYQKGAPYRATVCGFWDRSCLESLLIPGETPWNFEILGSYRTSYLDGFYSLNHSLFDFINLIEKGMWIPDSVRKAAKLGITLDLNQRDSLQGKKTIKSWMQRIYFNLIMQIPWRYRVAIMTKLRKALISY